MIQAVFFDFDQTLFSHRNMSIPQSAIRAIEKLHEKDILCVLATGRHMLELEMFPQVFEIGLDGYVTIDGQLCLDRDRRIVCSSEISGRDLEDLLHLFESKEVPTILVEDDKLYLNRNKAIAETESGILLRHPVGEYSGRPIYLGIAYIGPEKEAWLSERLPGCTLLRWSTEGVDIVPKGRDKVAGIHEYLEHHGIPKHNYMAFGDGDNDKAMLRDAGIGVAMGNAREDVKECASYVTEDIDEDGIYNALLHFGLI